MKKYKIIGILSLCILFIVFVFQNSASVTTKFLFFQWNMPKALLISISVLFGVILGVLATMKK